MAKVKASKAVIAVSKNLNKHGKIKGSNKKETKELRAMCQHHHLSKKKNKVKPTVYTEGDMCACSMCKESWSKTLPNEEHQTEIFDKMDELVNQLKFISLAIGAGENSDDFVTKYAVLTKKARKMTKKLIKGATKSNKIKTGKNKNNNNAPTTYGTWKNNN